METRCKIVSCNSKLSSLQHQLLHTEYLFQSRCPCCCTLSQPQPNATRSITPLPSECKWNWGLPWSRWQAPMKHWTCWTRVAAKPRLEKLFALMQCCHRRMPTKSSLNPVKICPLIFLLFSQGLVHTVPCSTRWWTRSLTFSMCSRNMFWENSITTIRKWHAPYYVFYLRFREWLNWHIVIILSQFSSSTSLMVLWSAHWQEIYSILLTDWSQLQTSWLITMSLHPRMARVMASWGP